MNDLNVIDRFMQAFITYIDAGFGLLGGDVHFLTVTLIGIDVTLAGLFWAMGGDDHEDAPHASFIPVVVRRGAGLRSPGLAPRPLSLR